MMIGLSFVLIPSLHVKRKKKKKPTYLSRGGLNSFQLEEEWGRVSGTDYILVHLGNTRAQTHIQGSWSQTFDRCDRTTLRQACSMGDKEV